MFWIPFQLAIPLCRILCLVYLEIDFESKRFLFHNFNLESLSVSGCRNITFIVPTSTDYNKTNANDILHSNIAENGSAHASSSATPPSYRHSTHLSEHDSNPLFSSGSSSSFSNYYASVYSNPYDEMSLINPDLAHLQPASPRTLGSEETFTDNNSVGSISPSISRSGSPDTTFFAPYVPTIHFSPIGTQGSTSPPSTSPRMMRASSPHPEVSPRLLMPIADTLIPNPIEQNRLAVLSSIRGSSDAVGGDLRRSASTELLPRSLLKRSGSDAGKHLLMRSGSINEETRTPTHMSRSGSEDVVSPRMRRSGSGGESLIVRPNSPLIRSGSDDVSSSPRRARSGSGNESLPKPLSPLVRSGSEESSRALRKRTGSGGESLPIPTSPLIRSGSEEASRNSRFGRAGSDSNGARSPLFMDASKRSSVNLTKSGSIEAGSWTIDPNNNNTGNASPELKKKHRLSIHIGFNRSPTPEPIPESPANTPTSPPAELPTSPTTNSARSKRHSLKLFASVVKSATTSSPSNDTPTVWGSPVGSSPVTNKRNSGTISLGMNRNSSGESSTNWGTSSGSWKISGGSNSSGSCLNGPSHPEARVGKRFSELQFLNCSNCPSLSDEALQAMAKEKLPLQIVYLST